MLPPPPSYEQTPTSLSRQLLAMPSVPRSANVSPCRHLGQTSSDNNIASGAALLPTSAGLKLGESLRQALGSISKEKTQRGLRAGPSLLMDPLGSRASLLHRAPPTSDCATNQTLSKTLRIQGVNEVFAGPSERNARAKACPSPADKEDVIEASTINPQVITHPGKGISS